MRTERRLVAPRSPNQAAYLRAIERHDLVFALGPAGTGKTYLAVATAVSLLRQRRVDRLILSRPAVEAGERLGFLPGDLREKVDPYLRPLYDALQDMLPEGKLQQRIETGQIEIAPLAYMRGRTLSNALVILDEAQNTTPSQMKMFLTRLGENSRMVVTGDPTQTDFRRACRPGWPMRSTSSTACPASASFASTRADIVRHPLVTEIIHAYEAAAAAAAGNEEEARPRPRGVSATMDSDSSHTTQVTVEAGPGTRPSPSPTALREAVAAALGAEAAPARAEVSVLLTDDDRLRALNRTGAARTSRPTSSPSRPWTTSRSPHGGEPVLLGDVVLAFETMEREARQKGKPLPTTSPICWCTARCTCSATTTRTTPRPSHGAARGRRSWRSSAWPIPIAGRSRHEAARKARGEPRLLFEGLCAGCAASPAPETEAGPCARRSRS